MLYLTISTLPSVYIPRYGVSRAKELGIWKCAKIHAIIILCFAIPSTVTSVVTVSETKYFICIILYMHY